MPDAARELTTWKEIAGHLQINVRTAQKWERERGLPIRRLPGGRGHVLTTVEDITAWKNAVAVAPQSGTATYRWPLDRNLAVEVQFTGAAVTSDHIRRLIAVLQVIQSVEPGIVTPSTP